MVNSEKINRNDRTSGLLLIHKRRQSPLRKYVQAAGHDPNQPLKCIRLLAVIPIFTSPKRRTGPKPLNKLCAPHGSKAQRSFDKTAKQTGGLRTSLVYNSLRQQNAKRLQRHQQERQKDSTRSLAAGGRLDQLWKFVPLECICGYLYQ